MSACDAYRDQIERRVDGLRDAEFEASLAAHLSRCRECRDYEQAQRALSVDLTVLSRVAHELTAPSVAANPTGSGWIRIATRAAAIALVILGTWTIVRKPNAMPIAPSSPPIAGTSNAPQLERRPIRFAAHVEPLNATTRFAVPIETDNPRVHVVWLYDSLNEIQEPAPASAPSL